MLRALWPGGAPERGVSACWPTGRLSDAVSEDVLRPLAADSRLGERRTRSLRARMARGAVWACAAKRRTALSVLVQDS